MAMPIVIGAAAGLASALLFASGVAGPVALALLLFLLSPLPVFLAALGWGPRASLAAGALGIVTAALLHGPRLATIYLLSIALPVSVLCWLAFLSRDGAAAGQREWYPPGGLVAWAAVMAGCLSLASLFAIWGDIEAVRATARAVIARYAKDFGTFGPQGLTPDDLEAKTSLFVRILPAASASSWLFMTLTNLWLAGRVLLASSRLARPWPDLARLQLPPMLAAGLGVSLLGLAASGFLGLAAGAFAGAFMFAYALLGLAVVHGLTRGNAYRPVILAFAWLAAFVLAPYGTVMIATLGLLDQLLALRGRAGRGPGAGPPSTS